MKLSNIKTAKRLFGKTPYIIQLKFSCNEDEFIIVSEQLMNQITVQQKITKNETLKVPKLLTKTFIKKKQK